MIYAAVLALQLATPIQLGEFLADGAAHEEIVEACRANRLPELITNKKWPVELRMIARRECLAWRSGWNAHEVEQSLDAADVALDKAELAIGEAQRSAAAGAISKKRP